MSGLPSPAKPSLREGQDDGCSKSIIRILTVLMCVAVMTGELGLARVQAALPHEYVGIRILQPPDPRPNPDPEGCQAISGQKCEEIGPAYPAGISDAGDVFGHIETNHPHNHHFEQGIRWLREDSYKGDFLGTFELEPKEWGFVRSTVGPSVFMARGSPPTVSPPAVRSPAPTTSTLSRVK